MIDDDAPIVLSASSVTAFLRCRYAWYLGEVMRLPSPPNVAMALGSAVHAGVERLLNGLTAPEDALSETFAREVALIPEPEEDPALALSDGLVMLTTYTRDVAPTFRPTMVEAKFVVEVEGVHWTGIIDGADENDLRDVKTTSGKTINGRKPSFDPQRHRLQLTGYRLGYKALTGNWPRRLLLDVLKRTGKYHQVEIEPDTGGLLDVIRLTRDAIMQRDFSPTGALNGSCYTCHFRRSCEYSIARD